MTSAPAPPQERPLIVGRDEGPEDPFPLCMEGNVTTGFQRGSSLVCYLILTPPELDTLTP